MCMYMRENPHENWLTLGCLEPIRCVFTVLKHPFHPSKLVNLSFVIHFRNQLIQSAEQLFSQVLMMVL